MSQNSGLNPGNSIRKILWALDPFENAKNKLEGGIVSTLTAFAEGRECIIEPVYVLSPDHLELPMELSEPWIQKYQPLAQKALENQLDAVRFPGLQPAKTVVHPRSTLKGTVRKLIQYAMETSADLIVVGSHARSGLPRLFLGSFAETLLLESEIPVLVVGPGSHTGPKIESILVPTDFGENSYALFQSILNLAKGFRARVTLLHVIPRPLEPVFASGVFLLGGGWVSVPAFFEKEEEKQKKIAERWISRSADTGVTIDYVIDRDSSGVVESIIKRAESEKNTMIAMAAQSGPIASQMLGSITRKVVRSAPCPVWVLRSR